MLRPMVLLVPLLAACGQQPGPQRPPSTDTTSSLSAPKVVGYAVDGAAQQWVLYEMPDGRVQRCVLIRGQWAECVILPRPMIP
jgi:uncharacterized lipoprotein